MSEERDFVELFKQSIECLTDANIDFVVVGGSILPYYGHTRSTEDIDIMIITDGVKDINLQKLVKNFDNNNLSLTFNDLILGIEEKVHITVFDMINFVFRIDLKSISTELDRLTYQTRRNVTLHDIIVPISSPESLIAVKSLEGFRSHTDLEDIVSLIELTDFDFDLLEKFIQITNSKVFLCSFLKNEQTVKIIQFIKNLKCQIDT